jgi:hypothetical protein
VGIAVGCAVGLNMGMTVGCKVGLNVGIAVGSAVGLNMGMTVGCAVVGLNGCGCLSGYDRRLCSRAKCGFDRRLCGVRVSGSRSQHCWLDRRSELCGSSQLKLWVTKSKDVQNQGQYRHLNNWQERARAFFRPPTSRCRLKVDNAILSLPLLALQQRPRMHRLVGF